MRRTESEEPLVLLDEGEQEVLELDFTDFLAAGETVSSATVAAENVTAVATATSPKVTLTLSGAQAFGTATVTVTLSSGAKLVEAIEVRNRVRYADPVFRDDCVA